MLEIKHLTAKRKNKTVLNDISFSLKPHTVTAVIGKNGCGKSTLCECINQTVPYVGEILYSGRNIALMPPRERASYISFLPQCLASPHITVRELIALGRSPYTDIGHRATKTDIQKCMFAAEETGVSHMLDTFVDELSGGERQKAYLAMTLAQDTRIMLLDEPATYLDMEYERALMDTLTEIKSRYKKTILVVMHNLNYAMKYADNVAVIKDGSLAFYGSRDDCMDSGIIEAVFGVKKYVAGNELFFG
ncbi:MAG: ABC transporter ATP-binding protein [Oscillospiraceae bacterium]|nr:ABC transporter ATP-binding protein [Oscillospiraceae bacterium]